MNKSLYLYIKEKFNIEFKNKNLLSTALTHSSYANDHRHKEIDHLERLEFLGDAVIELIVSNYLYNQFPKLPEGELTKIRSGAVREETLANLAKEIELHKYVLLGKGEEQSNGRYRNSLLCDVFEAFIGAVYLDQGYQSAEDILEKLLFSKIKRGDFSHGMDYKTNLQEYLQKDGPVTIKYEVINETGPDHERKFEVSLIIDGKEKGVGIGTSKKRAEQSAAKVVYEKLIK